MKVRIEFDEEDTALFDVIEFTGKANDYSNLCYVFERIAQAAGLDLAPLSATLIDEVVGDSGLLTIANRIDVGTADTLRELLVMRMLRENDNQEVPLSS